MKTYFRFIRGLNGKGIGAVQIDECEFGQFKIGISICNPNDEFDKKTAHKVCEENIKNSFYYDFYEIIDGDWYDDVVTNLPKRGWLIGEVVSTLYEMSDDILMDYAREHFKIVRKSS